MNEIDKLMDKLEIKICLKLIKEAALEKEFFEFRASHDNASDLKEIIRAFAKKHPDKFYVVPEEIKYKKFIVISKD